MEAEDHEESFRDRISTVSKEGKRVWLYPKKPSGKYYNARTALSVLYLLVFFSLPLIKINGDPFFLFDIIQRKFILFGFTFLPRDFFLLGLTMITFMIFIVVFTLAYGRIFCGWVCPQTVFLEMVFRRIEYWIEGTHIQQRKLNEQPLNWNKFFKKLLKHLIFLGIAFLISNTFLAYIKGVDELKKWIIDSPFHHLGVFIPLVIFTGVFYWVFAFFREQVCTVACPYGRLQGVLLDKKSIVVAYDYKRGEPRGKIKKNEDQSNKGDCIDCHLCVDVCPTGIDIRNGTQLECVNCTACIDVCNEVMHKVNRPTGLIRYDSEDGIVKGRKFSFDARLWAFTGVLIAMLAGLTYMLASRKSMDILVLRVPGMTYQELNDKEVANLYTMNLFNHLPDTSKVHIKILEPSAASIKLLGTTMPFKVSPNEEFSSKLMIVIPKSAIDKVSSEVTLGLYDSEGKLIKKVDSRFLAPN